MLFFILVSIVILLFVLRVIYLSYEGMVSDQTGHNLDRSVFTEHPEYTVQLTPLFDSMENTRAKYRKLIEDTQLEDNFYTLLSNAKKNNDASTVKALTDKQNNSTVLYDKYAKEYVSELQKFNDNIALILKNPPKNKFEPSYDVEPGPAPVIDIPPTIIIEEPVVQPAAATENTLRNTTGDNKTYIEDYAIQDAAPNYPNYKYRGCWTYGHDTSYPILSKMVVNKIPNMNECVGRVSQQGLKTAAYDGKNLCFGGGSEYSTNTSVNCEQT